MVLLGGTNFDTKIRRQSIDPEDLIIAHIGAMDVYAKAVKVAAKMIEDGGLDAALHARYKKWDAPEAQSFLTSDLNRLTTHVMENNINPRPFQESKNC